MFWQHCPTFWNSRNVAQNTRFVVYTHWPTYTIDWLFAWGLTSQRRGPDKSVKYCKMSTEAELLQLIDRDIADGRRHLQDSHNNLEKVAAYCEGNYLQVGKICSSLVAPCLFKSSVKYCHERNFHFALACLKASV